jgi:hypothetical protein
MNNIAISLGYNCDPAMYGIENNLRKSKKDGYKTCPFDLMITNYDGVVKCILDDFSDFLNFEYLICDNFGNIKNLKYKFLFNHESPSHPYLHTTENWVEGNNHFINNNFKNFIDRYEKRINNFKNYLNDKNNFITFILTSYGNENNFIRTYNEIDEIKNALNIKYPELKYKILLI